MSVVGSAAVASAQLALALLWTAYAVMLPGLVEAAGMPASVLPWVILLDQLVFLVADPVMGVLGQRVGRGFLGVGPPLVVASTLAGVLLVALPWLGTSGAVLVPLVVLWCALTSALRVPPVMLLRRHLSPDAFPGAVGLSMVGFGLAGALSPYLALVLKGLSPTLPFLLASGALVLAALALWGAEWVGRRASVAETAPDPASSGVRWVALAALFLGTGAVALAVQAHTFGRMASLWSVAGLGASLPLVVPVFWLAFAVTVGPAGWVVGRPHPATGPSVLAVGALVLSGGLGLAAAGGHSALPLVVGLGELAAGMGWAAVFAGGVATAGRLVSRRNAGWAIGGWFGVLSGAAAVRLLGVGTGLLPAAIDQAPLAVDIALAVTVLVGLPLLVAPGWVAGRTARVPSG